MRLQCFALAGLCLAVCLQAEEAAATARDPCTKQTCSWQGAKGLSVLQLKKMVFSKNANLEQESDDEPEDHTGKQSTTVQGVGLNALKPASVAAPTSLEAANNTMQIQPVQEIVLSKFDVTERKPLRVAVFAQAFHLHLLPDLQQCITNVGAAQNNTGSTVDVYLSTPSAKPNEIPEITERVKQATPALGRLEVQLTQNKGADIGQLLQQMQSASGHDYDTILKIHTKSDDYVRRSNLNHLCGSADIAQKIIASFATNPALGLVGAHGYIAWKGLPGGSPCFGGFVWATNEQENMKKTWSVISPDAPMPPEDAWTSTVMDFWWSRGSSVTHNPVLLAAVDRLLASMKLGYTSGITLQPEHAMERLIATMVRATGAVVAHVRP